MIVKPRLNSMRFVETPLNGDSGQRVIQNASLYFTRRNRWFRVEMRDEHGQVLDWSELPVEEGDTMVVGPFDLTLDIQTLRESVEFD